MTPVIRNHVHPFEARYAEATPVSELESAAAGFDRVDGNVRLESHPDHDLDDELRQQMLAYGLRYDMQTGLLNHQSFQESLKALLRDRSSGSGVALLWIDLVNLRREFSLWGWTGAEALARRVASMLRSVADDDALLGRVGGRTFLVAMEASKLDKSGRQRVQAVVDALAPLRQRGQQTEPEVAAGVAFFPSDADSAEDLVRFASLAANRALYLKSQVVVPFNGRMNSALLRDHVLEVEMRKGLDEGQFSIVYQPKVDLRSGQILGAEALIRWNHPRLGEVTPGEFIPVAERSDLIDRIFDMGLRSALEDARRWREAGLGLPIVAVNASAANLRAHDFVRSVRNIMAEIPVAPTVLELEMTESLAFEDEDLFRSRLRQLKAIGVRVAIDDFGTRYTGFNVLKRLPLDTMKIDRCFIQGIDRSEDMRALCRTIVAMARQLKLRTVAEGIEEIGEFEALREIGCDAGQGFLFQRPTGAANFQEFLREWPRQMQHFGFAQPDPGGPARIMPG